MRRSVSVLLASLLVSLFLASGALAPEGHGHEASATSMVYPTTGVMAGYDSKRNRRRGEPRKIGYADDALASRTALNCSTLRSR
ncbi:MAG TPA: hypothetical protein VGV91_12210, partial [Rubrobacter sp.]|nr:hypothetical protein [Rubrobacter sp.]